MKKVKRKTKKAKSSGKKKVMKERHPRKPSNKPKNKKILKIKAFLRKRNISGARKNRKKSWFFK